MPRSHTGRRRTTYRHTLPSDTSSTSSYTSARSRRPRTPYDIVSSSAAHARYKRESLPHHICRHHDPAPTTHGCLYSPTTSSHSCHHSSEPSTHGCLHDHDHCLHADRGHMHDGPACLHAESPPTPTCLLHGRVMAELPAPACRQKCCKHKKDDGPQVPVIVRFRSQKGESSLVRLKPPTFAELERYVEEEYDVDDPELLHLDELGISYVLTSEADLAHAVSVTSPERYLTIVIGRFSIREKNPCCCCGHRPPKPKVEKARKMDPIFDWNNAPPGLRKHLRRAPPFHVFTEMTGSPLGDPKPKLKKPMLKAFIP